MKAGIRSATALLLACSLAGCSAMQKPWGKCALAGGLIGATAGGVAGGVAANNGAFNNGQEDDETRGAAIGIGIASGALVGALAGHLLCDKEAPAPAPAPVAAPPPPAPRAPMLVLRGTNFAFDSATLTTEGTAALAGTLESLKTHPDLRISVEGHTDSVGSDQYNMRLSERRAQAVKKYLVAEGIAADRIQTRSFGESKPVVSNSTAQGRAENRRVEVYKAE